MASSSQAGDMTSSSQAGVITSSYAQQALLASYYTLTCEGGFLVVGMQDGEASGTAIRTVCTLITVSITSAWFKYRKVSRLLLFFSHWLSGLVHQLAMMALHTLVSVCWTSIELEKLIKSIKFLELMSSNMLAVTNLAICVNLALIISSHRTMSRVKSLSSPSVIFFLFILSAGAAAAALPFYKGIAVSGTLFWGYDHDSPLRQDWIIVSQFFLEFGVGISMLLIVSTLLVFRMKEIKECWKIHARIRFYFLLTLVATAVNLALGVCGTIYVLRNLEGQLLISVNWICRHVHIALDTIVLYGVLGVSTRSVDERPGATKSSDAAIADSSTTSSTNRYNTRPSFANGKNGNAHRKVHSSHNSLNQAPLARMA